MSKILYSGEVHRTVGEPISLIEMQERFFFPTFWHGKMGNDNASFIFCAIIFSGLNNCGPVFQSCIDSRKWSQNSSDLEAVELVNCGPSYQFAPEPSKFKRWYGIQPEFCTRVMVTQPFFILTPLPRKYPIIRICIFQGPQDESG